MLAAIKAEKNNQDLDEARQRLAALRASFDLKRQAARAELRVLEIKRDRAHGRHGARRGQRDGAHHPIAD